MGSTIWRMEGWIPSTNRHQGEGAAHPQSVAEGASEQSKTTGSHRGSRSHPRSPTSPPRSWRRGCAARTTMERAAPLTSPQRAPSAAFIVAAFVVRMGSCAVLQGIRPPNVEAAGPVAETAPRIEMGLPEAARVSCAARTPHCAGAGHGRRRPSLPRAPANTHRNVCITPPAPSTPASEMTHRVGCRPLHIPARANAEIHLQCTCGQ